MENERRQDDTDIIDIKKTLYGNGRKGIAYTVESISVQIKVMYTLQLAIIAMLSKIIFFSG